MHNVLFPRAGPVISGPAVLTPWLIGLMIACTPSATTKTGDPPATCAREGDSCTFSPGKLGVCTAPGDGRTSLVCQSLH
jgi:hypothetical protein